MKRPINDLENLLGGVRVFDMIDIGLKPPLTADWTTLTIQAVFVLFVVYRQNHVLTVLPSVFSDT